MHYANFHKEQLLHINFLGFAQTNIYTNFELYIRLIRFYSIHVVHKHQYCNRLSCLCLRNSYLQRKKKIAYILYHLVEDVTGSTKLRCNFTVRTLKATIDIFNLLPSNKLSQANIVLEIRNFIIS